MLKLAELARNKIVHNRRKFRSQASDNMDGKAEVGRVREEAKAADAKPSGEMRDRKCTPLWQKHISKSKS